MLTNQVEKDMLGYLIGYSESGAEGLFILQAKCIGPRVDGLNIARKAVLNLIENGLVEEVTGDERGRVYRATQKGRDEQKTWPENQGW